MTASVSTISGSRQHGGLAPLLSSVVLFASAWPLTKTAIGMGAAPLWFAEGRAALSGLTAALILALFGRLQVPGRADAAALLTVGGLQLAAYFAFAHAALAWVPAGRTAILANTTTIWIVPLSVMFLPEPVSVRRWVAAAMALAGVAVLMGPWAIDWTRGPVLIGNMFLLGAGLSWSVAIIVMRRCPPNLTMFQLLPWCFALASVLLAPLVWWEAPHGGLGRTATGWLVLGYIGFVAGPIGTWCVMEATARLPTLVSSIGFLATPALSVILASLMLGEPMTADLLAGSALILGGVAAAAWPQGRA